MEYSSFELRAALFFRRIYFLGPFSPVFEMCCFPDVGLGAGRVLRSQKKREAGRVLGAGWLTGGRRALTKLGALGPAGR